MKRRLIILIVSILLLVPAVLPTQAQTCVQTYIVLPGDSLTRIANQFGTTVAALVSINSLPNPNYIFRGQTLCVQIYTPPPQNPIYVVQRGDWLALIARRFGVSLWALIQANPLMNPNLIYPGQALVIPIYGGYAPNMQPQYAPNNPPMNAPGYVPPNNPPIYTPPMSSGGGVMVPPPNATPEASG